MNERIEELMMEATKDMPQGFYVPSRYFEKFANLIVQDVVNLFGDERISLHYLEQPCCEDAVTLLQSKIMDHFGVKNDN